MRLGSGTFAACCVVIEVLGVALFLRGFFPVPVCSFSGTEHQTESPAAEPSAGAISNWTKLPPPLFSKVVIMLIDALRDDFVFGSKGVKFMPYTTYLVEKGSSHSFVAEAKPPTVTMPRIKALMTGSLPGFIDVVRNLNSPTLLEDNVITRAKAAGKRIIFYGDETWVKLFPKHFLEYDGTTSFFVSDYTEVDDNVTRHLDKVLKRRDWDVLILHYLGLDHIGHVSGPSSPLIGRKLSEMDSVLMKIHASLLSENPPPSNSRWSELDLLILSGTVGHVLSLGASSFIEEEHQTWYFLVNTLCLALCHEIYRNCFVGDDCAPQRCPHAGEEFDGVAAAPQGKSTGPDVWELDRASKHPSPLEALRGPERWMVLASPWVILSCCRLLRSLNQTGVQWAHRPDLGHWLTSSDHKAELSVLATVSLIMIFVLVQKRCSLASKVAMAFGLLGIYCYRVAVGNLLFPWQQNNKDISNPDLAGAESQFSVVLDVQAQLTG
ncbi:hypothetical protein E2I00_014758 [Balaenoptera physalus]|uniref:GPI ethanolamine phosphate transferase 2 n=1 Tax=Balaenoptera physalus TaxID=9770 RepID=A0A643BLN7_BALPH|nr:hypothetical protein E2I00_014758 [Balaenoptera physalus]